jgi:hypothetical protein
MRSLDLVDTVKRLSQSLTDFVTLLFETPIAFNSFCFGGGTKVQTQQIGIPFVERSVKGFVLAHHKKTNMPNRRNALMYSSTLP